MEQSSRDIISNAIIKLHSVRADNTAWKILLSQLWPRLLATAYRILRGQRQLAEDVTQESLIKLYRHVKFGDFIDNPEAFQSYALAVCRNVSLNYLARLVKELDVSESLDNRLTVLSSPDDNPELTAIRFDLLAQMTIRLEPTHRQLLDLLLEGYTIGEIADRLKISYSATAVRIHRIRNELSQIMETL